MPVALASIFILLFGIYVLLENVKSIINISFFISCLTAFVWLSGMALLYSTKNSEFSTSFYLRYTLAGVVFIGPSVYFMTASILRINREKRNIIIANFAIMLILYILSQNENWLITGVKTYFWGRYTLYGKLSYLIIPAFIVMMVASLTHLYLAFKNKKESAEKNQFRLQTIALFIAFLGAVDFIPCFGIEIYPVGYIFILAFIAIQTYSIVNYGEVKSALIVQNTPNGVIIIDRNGFVSIINPNVDNFLGFNFSKYLGRKIFDINATNKDEKLEINIIVNLFRQFVSSPAITSDEVIYFPLSGKYVNIRSSKINDRFGEVLDIEMVLIDITKQKILEDELREYQENLEDLVKIRTKELIESHEKLEKAYEELKTIDQLKNNIISNVSHELRTPLTVIKSSLKLLKELVSLDNNAKQIIDAAEQAVITQSYVIQNLTEAAYLENEKVSLNISEFDLSDLIIETCDKFKSNPLTTKNEITINYDIQKNIPTIKSDYKKLELILDNLITNAIKYNKPNGVVTITAKKLLDLEVIEICVSDTGIGISKDNLDKIFDQLYQIDSSANRKFPGIGMGLFIVKEFTKILGGKIKVESIVGEGSKFYLIIPISIS